MKTKLHLIASQRFFSTIESAKTRIGMALKSLLLILAIANTGLACADITEFVGSVEAVDIEKGVVTFSAKQFNAVDYRFAYDVRIRLANGDIGAAANLREGNLVTAVVNPTQKQVSFIQVHE